MKLLRTVDSGKFPLLPTVLIPISKINHAIENSPLIAPVYQLKTIEHPTDTEKSQLDSPCTIL